MRARKKQTPKKTVAQQLEYFSLLNVLSKRAIINIVIGMRNVGKTYAFKEWAIKDFLKRGNQFVYIRRHEHEVDAVKNMLFDDIAAKFDVEIKIRKTTYMIRPLVESEDGEEMDNPHEWKIFGHIIPLSRQQRYKSAAFPHVTKICYDEFIIENTRERYLPDEVDLFLGIYDTIARGRKVNAVLLSNSGFISNPFFQGYNIKNSDFKDNEFVSRNNGAVIAQYYYSAHNAKILSQGVMGRIATNTYHKYAIESQFKDISTDNVRPDWEISKKLDRSNLKLDNGAWVILNAHTQGVYIRPGRRKDVNYNYTTDKFDTTEDVIYSPKLITNLKNNINNRNIYFKDMDTKALFYNSLHS